MSQLQEQINRVKETALEELAVVTDLTGLDEWRIKFLGKKGELTGFLRSMGAVSAEERPAVGQAVNAAKVALESAVDERAVVLKEAAIESNLASDRVDVTLPGRPVTPGYIHIINKTLRDITESFTAMGFQVYEGPEVELDYYNFELLNMPPGHPARSMHDTFYFSESTLLRTHTSPNQIRVAEKLQPPIRIIVPGKCYRSEATDATHEFMFYQCELMVVDKNVTLADLRGTLADFARRLFGQERKVRFRCDYFPYVEPGVDLSIDCGVCKGVGCRSCKYTGWLEIMGAGMIHPQVLRNVGIDPEVYSGYAAGMGPERISMLKYGIDDIRQFYRNDLRFLSQFA
ncbi:phenylalanine--tRNA ligase subunit alpha [Candidatus Chlorohelix allophototropha]|uniref:Phenylalanine--tRNA ligase alpha subunit n=1 Tax=Candidatus Chlorohelix allophototropha TaxID=3003348 RepID=A0ABY9B0H4_9CHLR|nr:phenylalanine--tRNA ligase subunit alpha [Chloroflexota bacterium L227-S17]